MTPESRATMSGGFQIIQNTQNRDARAIHLKLDEVIHAIGKAHDEMIQIEALSDKDLDGLAAHFKRIRRELVVRIDSACFEAILVDPQ